MARSAEGWTVETSEAVRIAGLTGQKGGIVVGCVRAGCVAIGVRRIKVD